MLSNEDRSWVDEGYSWLASNYPGPLPTDRWIELDQARFPRSQATRELLVGNILDDLCRILGVERTLITHGYIEDRVLGRSAASRFSVRHGDDGLELYTIDLAVSHGMSASQLLKQCTLWMVHVRLRLSGVMMPESGEERRQCDELAAIFFGFGPIMAQRRNETVLESNGRWTTTTTHRPALPRFVFAYALAVHQKEQGIDDGSFFQPLPTEVRYDVKEVLATGPANPVKSKRQLTDFQQSAFQAAPLIRQNKYDLALAEWQKALAAAGTHKEKALAEHNIGYAFSCMGKFRFAIDHLQRALDLNPDQTYAHDNLGFAFTMLGRLDEAARSLEAADGAKKRHPGYLHRNRAVLHWMQGDMRSAEKHFAEAFDHVKPVDFLNALYARFLRCQDRPKEAAIYERVLQEEFGGSIPDWVLTLGA